MRAATVLAPNGCEWKVRAFRVRLPPWRQVDLGVDEFDLFSAALWVVAAPFTLVVIPLALALFEFPVAIGRAAFSRTAWVEAVSEWPHEERVLWRTTQADAPGVRVSVAAQLAAGEALRPARAELVERPRPPV
jgi:hypothetical protein